MTIKINSLSRGLVGHWPLSSKYTNGSSALDLTGQNPGTISGATVRNLGGMFNSTDNYIGLGVSMLGSNSNEVQIGDSPYSICGWFKVINDTGLGSSTTGDSAASIIGHASQYGFGVQIHKPSNIKLNFGSRSNSNFSTTQDLSLNVWYHFVCVREVDVNNYIYINGILDNTYDSSLLDVTDTSAEVQIGYAETRVTNYFGGNISDLKIFNYALSPSQVTQLYKNSRSLTGNVLDMPLSNDFYDHGPNNYTTVNNGAVLVGEAGDFDGVSDYVTIAESPKLILSTSITLSAWTKISQYQATGGQTDRSIIVAKPYAYYMSITSSTGKLASYFYGFDQTHRDTTAQIPLNTWTLCTITYDGTSIKYYYNDVLDYTWNDTGNIIQTSSNSVDIGMEVHGNYGRNFNGQIKDVRIYNRALSADEVSLLYKTTSPIGVII